MKTTVDNLAVRVEIPLNKNCFLNVRDTGHSDMGERVGRQEGDGNFSNAFDLLNMAGGAKS